MGTYRKRVIFTFEAPQAETVYLAGTFNAWSHQADPMKKDQAGIWRKTKILAQGTYQFKYIVDGNWVLDPSFQEVVADSSGVLNHSIQV